MRVVNAGGSKIFRKNSLQESEKAKKKTSVLGQAGIVGLGSMWFENEGEKIGDCPWFFPGRTGPSTTLRVNSLWRGFSSKRSGEAV